MKVVLALVFVGLIAAASAQCTGRTTPDSYVGDLSSEDNVVSFNGAGFVALPELKIGAAYQTFELEAYTNGDDGCLFSFGTQGVSYIELRVVGRKVQFTAGATTGVKAVSKPIWEPQWWHHVAVIVDNNANTAQIYVDGIAILTDSSDRVLAQAIQKMPLAARSGFIGYCGQAPSNAQKFLTGAVDNFMVSNTKKSIGDLFVAMQQFFPVVRENDLVAYWSFNEAPGNTQIESIIGTATQDRSVAELKNGPVLKARAAVPIGGDKVANKFCAYKGAGILNAQNQNIAPYYGVTGGGYTNSIRCGTDADPALTINQKWSNDSQITQMTVFLHREHRFRITPGPYLAVEHAEWGGWAKLAESVGVISEDKSTYQITKETFLLQAAGVGWVRISMVGGFLRYEYAVLDTACSASISNFCAYVVTPRNKYFFEHITMMEPMGGVRTTKGIASLPATLACPTPGIRSYSPLFFCWGWYLGPKNGWHRRWDGSGAAWHYGSGPNDECCHTDVTGNNQNGAEWALGYRDQLPANRQLPWCNPNYHYCWGWKDNAARYGAMKQDAACCVQWKYQNQGQVSSSRLPYCSITNDDCWLGTFDASCCNSDSLRYRTINGNSMVLDKCSITENDCWSWKRGGVRRTDQANRCCASFRYYQGNTIYPGCTLTMDDCWNAPGKDIAEVQQGCCANNLLRYNPPLSQKSLSTKWADYCTPSNEECWNWKTKGWAIQKDNVKCCTPANKIWVAPSGQAKDNLIQDYCKNTITWEDCHKGVKVGNTYVQFEDQACCKTDELKYARVGDVVTGAKDPTRRVPYCAPTVDDCWGWYSNPAVYGATPKQEDLCCTQPTTRYYPQNLLRLFYCEPNLHDCWGWYLTNSLRDEDTRCCSSFPVIGRERLPYCGPSTPIPPPVAQPPPPPPSIPADVCNTYKVANPAGYAQMQSVCNAVWGSSTSSSYLTCLAQACKNEDPNTPTVPDCRIERLLKAADTTGTYVLPASCSSGCPNGCYGRGTCTNGKCVCQAAWTGADCSIPKEFNSCNYQVQTGTRPGSQCQPVQLTYSNRGVTPLLTQDFTNASVQYYYGPSANRIQDSVLIYMAKTIQDFNTRAEDFHLFVVNNDGNGFFSGSYTMDIDFPVGTDLSGTQWSRIGKNANVQIIANKIRITASWTYAESNGVVIRYLPGQFQSSATVKLLAGASVRQVLVGCTSPQGAFEVTKLTQGEIVAPASGFNLNCKKINTACNHDNCKDCAADSNCGWCVETGSCQPGNPTGPFTGQCLNWRFTFDAVTNRRLTQITGFPINQKFTDVWLSQSSAPGANQELPIEVGIFANNPSSIPWDVVLMSEFTPASQPVWLAKIGNILTQFAGMPNMGVAFAALRQDAQGYNFVKVLTNPRDTTGIPATLANIDKNTWTSGSALAAGAKVNVRDALFLLSKPDNNDFNLRSAARPIVVISTMAGLATSTRSDATIKTQLLARGIVPLFVVPDAIAAEYRTFVNTLGFGMVIPMNDWANLQFSISAAISQASTTVALVTNPGVDSGHVDTALFAARAEAYQVFGIKAPMRAKFWVPVKRQTVQAGGLNTAELAANLYFPVYGKAVVESVATDAPIGLTASPIKTKQYIDQPIELRGRSFRNLFKVGMQVTALPTKGSLFAAVMGVDVDGITPKVVIDPVQGQILTVPFTLTSGRLLYRQDQSGIPANDFGENYDQFKYRVFDGCTQSVEYTVVFDVAQGNTAPVAAMVPPRGYEGTPMVIQLDGYDEQDDTFDAIITRNVFDVTEKVSNSNPVGKLYQYPAGLTDLQMFNPAIATEITSVPVQVTDSLHRIIYVPPYYGHSFADPLVFPELLIIPCFSYKIKENGAQNPKLTSNVLDVQIVLDHVNQKPFAWNDPQQLVRDVVFKYAWPNPSTFANLECWGEVTTGATDKSCNWKEDFGNEYPFNVAEKPIAVGGYDIERSDLDVIITQLDCHPQAKIAMTLDDNENILVGQVIKGIKSGKLTNILNFKPAPETDDSSMAPKPYYCRIGYVVRDEEGAISEQEGVVNIHIENVNKPPRMTKQSVTVTAYEQQQKLFSLDATDPDGDAFDAYVVSCGADKGTLQFCTTFDCSTVEEVDCSTLVEAAPGATGTKIPVCTDAPEGIRYVGVFQSDKLIEAGEGQSYNNIKLQFRDGNSGFVPRLFDVYFRVIKINHAPKILHFVGGQLADGSSFTDQRNITIDWTGKFMVEDDDVGLGHLLANITLNNDFAVGSEFILSGAAQADSIKKYIVKMDAETIRWNGPLTALNVLVNAISVKAPQVPLESHSKAQVVLVVDDQGYNGQCPDATDFSAEPCPLQDTMTINIEWLVLKELNGITVAASASAAAFAGVAAVAAAVLFRKFNQKAEDSYEPWNIQEEDEGVISNPLYEQSGSQGVNPLFEGGNDKL
jgi:hypothetical protein